MVYIDCTSLYKIGPHCLNTNVRLVNGFQVDAFDVVLVNKIETVVICTTEQILKDKKELH